LNKILFALALLILSITAVKGQIAEKEKFVQVSGIITDEQYRPVSGVAVVSKKT
jgi:hypothetical protein